MARYGRDYGGYDEGGSYGRYTGGADYGSEGYGGSRGYGWGAPHLDRGWASEGLEGWGWNRGEYGAHPAELESQRNLGRGGPQRGWSAGYAIGGQADIGGYPGYGDLGGSAGRMDWETDRAWGGESDADRVRAGDLMTENPDAVTPDTTLTEVAQRMRDLDVGIIPVVDSQDSFRLRGVITDRDITVRAAADGKDMKKTKVSESMTEDVETVGVNDHVRDIFSVMKRARVRRVPVTDRDGRLVGIIAQADLAVDYAGLDLERETEVEEVIERISEPAQPQWGRGPWGASGPRRYMAGGRGRAAPEPYDRDLGDRLRSGWRTIRNEARHMMPGYGRRWW